MPSLKKNLDTSQQIQAVLNQSLKQYDLPALSVSIFVPGNGVQQFAAGTVKLNGKKAITPDSLFQFGSVTKTYTAAVIMKLVQLGKLKLSDPLGKFFPEYPRWSSKTFGQTYALTPIRHLFL